MIDETETETDDKAKKQSDMDPQLLSFISGLKTDLELNRNYRPHSTGATPGTNSDGGLDSDRGSDYSLSQSPESSGSVMPHRTPSRAAPSPKVWMVQWKMGGVVPGSSAEY